MLLMITVALVTLAALNAILTAWATVLDTRHVPALMRTLGANSRQVSSGSRRHRCFPRRQEPSSAARSASGYSRPRPEAGLPASTSAGRHLLGTLLTVAALTTVTAGHRRPPARRRDPASRNCLIMTPPSDAA